MSPTLRQALEVLVAAHDTDPPMLTSKEWEDARAALAAIPGTGPVDPEALDRLIPSLLETVKHAIAGTDFGKPMDPAQAVAEYADYCANADDSEATIYAAAVAVATAVGITNLKPWTDGLARALKEAT